MNIDPVEFARRLVKAEEDLALMDKARRAAIASANEAREELLRVEIKYEALQREKDSLLSELALLKESRSKELWRAMNE